MHKRRKSERLRAERILALSREVEAAIQAAADQRASVTRDLVALLDSQRTATKLSNEADRLLKDVKRRTKTKRVAAADDHPFKSRN